MTTNRISPDIIEKVIHLEKGQTFLNEAQFGLDRILESVRDLPSGSRILEVGSGAGILLTELSRLFPEHTFVGIEPNGQGFQFFSDFQLSLGEQVKIHNGGYETFESDDTWDLIYSINVFEHLPDWRHFLLFLNKNLSSEGKATILCPNYSFPYEPHFGLPLIFSKKITFFLFQTRIEKFEKENDCLGLWNSLNFVKYHQVKSFVRRSNLKFKADFRIVEDMVQRLSSDKDFAQRQKLLAWPAKFLLRTGLLKFILTFPGVHHFLPYLQIEIKKNPKT